MVPSGGTNTVIFFTCRSGLFCRLPVCTQMFVHQKAQWETSFCVRKASSKMSEIQSWHPWQAEQHSILSHFYPIMTCHRCSSKTDNNKKRSPLNKKGLNVWGPYLDTPCTQGVWNLWFLVTDFSKVAKPPLQGVDSATSSMARKYEVF